MSVGRPPTITLSSVLIMGFIFSRTPSAVVEREELWWLQLECVGSFLLRKAEPATCRLLHHVRKTETIGIFLFYSYEPRCSLPKTILKQLQVIHSQQDSLFYFHFLQVAPARFCAQMEQLNTTKTLCQRLLVSLCRHYLSSSVRWAALDLFPIGTIGYTIRSREKPKQGIDLESGKFGIWTLLCIAVTNRSSIFLATSLATRNSSRYGPLQLLKCYHPWGYIQLSTG